MTPPSSGTEPAPSIGLPGPTDRIGPVVGTLLLVLRFYRRWISPALPPSCRFFPSCSEYAIEALTVHGVLRGSWWTVRRLLRCGPWHPGGVDPVPPARSPRSHAESES
ncbi:MAG: membrane protein insertion efficiency factor YidD [Pseudonocardiaceae bacterium]